MTRLQDLSGLHADAPDEILAGRAGDGDVAAFEALVRRHGPLMRAYARRLARTAEEADDVASAGADQSGWLEGMLANLRLETRAGRPIPLGGGPLEELAETEGAVVALVRSVGDALGGVLIGRCRLNGDISIAGAPVDVSINVSARYGHPLPSLAEELRGAVFEELRVQTELNVRAVNVAFTDLRPPLDGPGAAAPLREGEP